MKRLINQGFIMDIIKEKIGSNNFLLYSLKNKELIKPEIIVKSWNDNTFKYPINNEIKNIEGFRSAQLGALFSIKSYWTIKKDPATIVMPTGIGKTETMIATVISECRNKTCVIVPSDLLRIQTSDRFCTLNKLREIKAIDDNFLNPIVGLLKSNPKNINNLYNIVNSCNILITTCYLLNKMSEKTLSEFASNFDTLIIDEAHHIPAKSWEKVIKKFKKCKCLQFTATPFREDGKKIKGEIIYNFPLKLAQEQHFFKEFEFYGVEEFDAEKKDFVVAKKAVEILKRDVEILKFPHLLLVRVATQKRAKELFINIYNKFYSEYNPVLIISSNNQNTNREALNKVKKGTSKIIICVNMFSEGIDFPELKICAIHDKYKSLPITLQFIGRLARVKSNLGKASIIANTIDDDTNKAIEELYSQDSDWNQILRNVSDEKIEKELSIQKLSEGFKGNEIIPINNIVPKISMFIYRTSLKEWNIENLDKLFKKSTFNIQQNNDEKILLITELNSNKVGWTTSKDVNNSDWNLHLLYWNEEKQIYYINTTEKSIANKLSELVFPNSTRISGESIFRCLYGINRLMLSTVGLNSTVINNRIRYRMYAGIDIESGITEAIKGNSTKSNLFGVGYENGKEISIGCSYKGTVWAKWVETIDYWKHWCDKQSEKILNDKIETKELLKNVLIPKEINKRPNSIPYKIEFPITAENELKDIVYLSANSINYPFYTINIKLSKYNKSGLIYFEVCVNDLKEEFSLKIEKKKYTFSHKNGIYFTVKINKYKEVPLVEYLNNEPPLIWFVDGSYIEGNILVKPNSMTYTEFPPINILTWDWTTTNIKKESQGLNKDEESIQYNLISKLKDSNKYKIIFDDDNSGEIADVIAIEEDQLKRKMIIELYHCKYSQGEKPGSRVDDFYEVCGQSEKCIKWFKDSNYFFDRLIKRESDQINRTSKSRIELGNINSISIFKNKLKRYSVQYKVFIVQPGFSYQKINEEINNLLCCSASYLMDTYAIPLKLICSK